MYTKKMVDFEAALDFVTEILEYDHGSDVVEALVAEATAKVEAGADPEAVLDWIVEQVRNLLG